jgi:hypothetical protein
LDLIIRFIAQSSDLSTTIDQPGNEIEETIKYLIDEINGDNEISYKTIEIKTNLIRGLLLNP